jgi:O-antigen/teichoic acid export membrane protein
VTKSPTDGKHEVPEGIKPQIGDQIQESNQMRAENGMFKLRQRWSSSNIAAHIKNIKDRGFFHIFLADVINKSVSFFTVFALVRILSKQTYGEWSYALNVISIILLFQGMGSIPALLQYCSSAQSTSQIHSYFKFGIRVGLVSNIVLAVITFCIACFIPLPVEGSNRILLYLSFLPLITIVFESILMYLRSTFQNKSFSLLSVMNTILFFFGSVIGGLLFNVIGVALGRYFAYSVCIGGAIKSIRSEVRDIVKAKELEYTEKKGFLKFGIIAMLTNSISSMLYLIDIQLIGLFSKNAEIVASYQTATIIPFALNFIPLAIMTFSYPYFAKKGNNLSWVISSYHSLLKYLIPLNLAISGGLFILAPVIIPLIFGAQYTDSIVPFRILSLGYFIAGTFRIPAGNILASIKLIHINLFNSIICGILNIILDILLIPIYGATGAALTTVSIFVLSSIISNYQFVRLAKNMN